MQALLLLFANTTPACCAVEGRGRLPGTQRRVFESDKARKGNRFYATNIKSSTSW